VVAAPGTEAPPEIASEWLEGREAVGGRATAYVCRGTACSLPVHDPSELVAELVPGQS